MTKKTIAQTYLRYTMSILLLCALIGSNGCPLQPPLSQPDTTAALEVYNNTSFDCAQLYVVRSGSGSWGSSLISNPIPTGGNITIINLQPIISWDLKAVFSNGMQASVVQVAFAPSATQRWTLVDSALFNPNAPTPVLPGCYSATYSSYDMIGCGILQSLGDVGADNQLAQETRIQTSFWGISPRVHIFDECTVRSENSLSIPGGDILFGKYMFWNIVANQGFSSSAAGVLAHEWAHQIQYLNGWYVSQPTTRGSELEADAFSTYYLVLGKGWNNDTLNLYYAHLFNHGEYNFNTSNFHGTPQDRVAAGSLGQQTAAYALQGGYRYSYGYLHGVFMAAIGKHIVTQNTAERIKLDDGKQATSTEKIDIPFDVGEIRDVLAGNMLKRDDTVFQYDAAYRARLYPFSANDNR